MIFKFFINSIISTNFVVYALHHKNNNACVSNLIIGLVLLIGLLDIVIGLQVFKFHDRYAGDLLDFCFILSDVLNVARIICLQCFHTIRCVLLLNYCIIDSRRLRILFLFVLQILMLPSFEKAIVDDSQSSNQQSHYKDRQHGSRTRARIRQVSFLFDLALGQLKYQTQFI